MTDAATYQPPPALRIPAPEFELISARHVDHAATPTLVFAMAISEPEGHDVYMIALGAQIQIDPSRRGYDESTRERLRELLGPPETAPASTQSIFWTRIDTLVPSFLGQTTIELHVPCTYDLEVTTAKYFNALRDGSIPLSFHLSGTVYYRNGAGALQVVQVPWSATAQYSLPVAAWRAMIAEHYPTGGFIRLGDDTLAALQRQRVARGLPTFDACVAELLAGADA